MSSPDRQEKLDEEGSIAKNADVLATALQTQGGIERA